MYQERIKSIKRVLTKIRKKFRKSGKQKINTKLGNDLLSHAKPRSTIGAARFHFRVRDGISCFTCAIITKPNIYSL